MMAKRNSIPIRIDAELNEVLEDIKRKNDSTMVEATRDLAKAFKMKIKGTKMQRDIKF